MKTKKPMEIKLERTISAAPREVFRAWLDPKVPGTPWNMGDRLILQPKVDGLFYWLVNGTPHYGRFTKVTRPGIIQHTWMPSPNISRSPPEKRNSRAPSNIDGAASFMGAVPFFCSTDIIKIKYVARPVGLVGVDY